jgi:hypothetical protein
MLGRGPDVWEAVQGFSDGSNENRRAYGTLLIAVVLSIPGMGICQATTTHKVHMLKLSQQDHLRR